MSDLVEALRYEGELRVNEKEEVFGNSKSRADRVADDICHQAANRIEQLERELAEAKNAIAWANNSLFGSHGFFLSLNGGEPDEHHLDRAIEELKERARAKAQPHSETRQEQR